jgi:hypothetical protein
MERVEPSKAMNHHWPAAYSKAATIGNQIAQPASARPTSGATRLDAPAAGLRHYRIEPPIREFRDFHFELPGRVQYTFTRYFSTRMSASVAEMAHDSAGSIPD